jgi:hypothetical protein
MLIRYAAIVLFVECLARARAVDGVGVDLAPAKRTPYRAALIAKGGHSPPVNHKRHVPGLSVDLAWDFNKTQRRQSDEGK